MRTSSNRPWRAHSRNGTTLRKPTSRPWPQPTASRLSTFPHPYRDGNKRVGLLAIATFLGINRYDPRATDADVVTQIVALAANRISEADLADWIRTRSAKRK